MRNRKKGQYAILFISIYALSQWSLLHHLEPLGAGNFLKQQLAFNQGVWIEILNGWKLAGVLSVYKEHLRLDLIHPFWYAGALGFSLSYLTHKLGLSKRWRRACWIAMVAAFCDWGENALQMSMLQLDSFESVQPRLVFLSSVLSLLKWSISFSVLAVILILAAVLVFQRGGTLKRPHNGSV